ncbi:hypothetical protein [Streptomyces thermodiastaticus]|uniref:hypothetical protein n=1 Tax=Streptomyces thermodiastaticus TaxID=44061 RepID=UPI001679034D|nr:hypothetical protein [Streptomyces thermodiastaticus]MCE7552330.1 hypothetical protein [Streptomyces thermodiastaticus]GHF90362.1 hypothetical protein GCM10018787_43920 [Streptomyces thermodiastaticus]
MLTSENPVGDWDWETMYNTEVRPARAIETAVAVWKILARHELALPGGRATISARSVHDGRIDRVEAAALPLEREPLSSGTALAAVVDRANSLADGSSLGRQARADPRRSVL